ncbi:MAG TPA: DUF5132 domain-containing protein [Alphaproteobacteria bacterium]
MARLVSGRVLTAFVAGAAGGWFASYLWSSSSSGAGGLRPAAKEAIKAGLSAFERGRELAAELSENVTDLVAEAEAERKQGPGYTDSSLSEAANGAGRAAE